MLKGLTCCGKVLSGERQLVDDRLEPDRRDVAKLFFVANLKRGSQHTSALHF